jgi:DNA repair exonuclease SbcCD ATPase subunit
MSKNIAKGSHLQKQLKSISEIHSADDLCNQLNQLIQQAEWKIETAETFIKIIINNRKQFQLDIQQQNQVAKAIMECPLKYRAIVHLAIVSANFYAENGLRTLDGIVSKIGNFISDNLALTDGLRENILRNQGDNNVSQFIKEQVNTKDTTIKSVNNQKVDQKLDFLRNLTSLLICEGETSAIASRLNLILEVLADSNYYQQLTKAQPKLESDLKNRVKVVAELFQSTKPSIIEAKRLLLYGSYSQILANQQVQEINRLQNTLQSERELRKETDNYVFQLEQEREALKQQLEKRQNDIEQERELYAQLETSSQAKISQQREATLNNVRNRIEHELNKLERCLSSSTDSFQENSQIGLRIIKKIREQLTE